MIVEIIKEWVTIRDTSEITTSKSCFGPKKLDSNNNKGYALELKRRTDFI